MRENPGSNALRCVAAWPQKPFANTGVAAG